MNKFGNALWRDVADELRGGALKWWRLHREDLVELGSSEMRDALAGLRKRGQHGAMVEIVARMDPEQWMKYRDGNTAALVGIAARRAAVLSALKDLGWFAARVLSRKGLGVLEDKLR